MSTPPKVVIEIRSSAVISMGIDFHLIANFAALALITLAGPAVIFVLFYRRGAL
ncbi:photosystem II reaction center protein Ycf12/Psb30 [Synechococcus sp. CS-1331]|uniref:photosystem II reaction center protein Ycf12/Psb30 n=1 Tax=Synechococcus sp. CS-1331 TaxID=2847973 RepID=UPI0021E486D6|nr:photosystem II reaction center protein Ycf12 [Synechococcus sp. CS-1331]